MAREKKIEDRAERILGPVTIAQYLELGWINEWPLGVTATGLTAWKRGQRYPKGAQPSAETERRLRAVEDEVKRTGGVRL